MKQTRFQLVIPQWLKDELVKAAESKGISMSEYIKDTLKSSLSADTLKKPIAKNEPESNAD
jgi:predicted HicB family RNase H-like nuclease